MEISTTDRGRDPRVGERVRIRRERWRVAAVELLDACPLVTLDGLGPPNVHEQRQLLVPFEVVEPLAHLDAAGLPHLPWRAGRRRWRRAVRSALVANGPWTRLHGVDASHIEVLPYQLEPAIAVLEGRATRLLLADAVGLGKTVQAGVLLVELLARGAAQSALVLTPAGLRDQWRQELASRFNLPFDVVDFASAARIAAELPLGVNPWTTRRLAIASVDFIKRPEVLSAVRAHAWDVVIVDEAHLVSPGSERHAAVSLLCAAALFVVLLTATPHNGDRDAFASLCSLGLTDGAPHDACYIFRRSRSDVGMPLRRRVHRLQVRPSTAEVRMHAALDQYAVAVRADAADIHAGELLVSTLRKRALSSPSSLRASVDRRLRALKGEVLEEDEQLRLPLDDGGGEFDVGDTAPVLDLPVLRDRGREHAVLRRLRHAADEASHAESKLRALARLLRRLARRRERVLVFTEYRDTLLHVQRRVAPDALVLHGGLDRGERGRTLDTFTSGRAAVLLATDTAGEGLNLHQSCRCVVHLELPWNPVRLEQRVGRVDRLGQLRTVHAFCLVSRHRSEGELMARLHTRVASAAADVAMSSPLESRDDDLSTRFDRPAPRAHSQAAAHEAARVRWARAWRYPSGSKDANGPPVDVDTHVVARARGPLRRWLGGRALLMLHVRAVDPVGRIVTSGLVPLALSAAIWRGEPIPASGSLSDIARALTDALDPFIGARTDAFANDVPSRVAHRAFWTATCERALAIAHGATLAPSDLFQPGLFDRRAERVRALRADEQRALADVLMRRAARLETYLDPPTRLPARLLLVLP